VAEELNLLDSLRGKTMKKIAVVMSSACILLLTGVIRIQGQDQYPILDQVANKAI
jgi:hypothetical protein